MSEYASKGLNIYYELNDNPSMQQRYPLNRSEVIDLLRHHHVTPTQQRVEIAQVLFARPQHVSADQVLAMVNDDKAMVSKATVYNTLGLFASKGLIREVIVDPSKVFYDPTTTPHHHLFNVDTGELMDVPSDSCVISALPPVPQGTKVDGVDVVIRVRNCH